MIALETRYRRAIAAAAVAIALSAVTGCHKKDKAVNPASLGPAPVAAPAPTATLSADPLTIDLGQSVVLNWRTQNATTVTIDGIGEVQANGTQTVTPANSTNFHLTAKGDGGTTEANVRVTVRVPTAPAASTDNGDMGSEAAFHQNVQDIFFDYDSYDLRPDAQSSAQTAAAYLNAHTGIKLVIGGYCDERGSAEYNLALGENRANSAKTALVNAGVAASRIRVISYGKEKQFCTEQNESCWQQNRRAQFSMDR
ncbi:OmpA family protein [Edaphobacter flagellatus]|uniref:OmpA family protein n=1 Tax=Edaphobacter flagellatus TaxID=1933044 RepID=UPI0021B265CB|nr:OmpA family protein [Edaphobacter flagellatus]